MVNNEKFGLTKQAIDKINSVFCQFPSISKVLIYGSRAKGNFKPTSDIDLTLIGQALTTTDLLKIENALDDLLLPYKIDLSLMSHIKQPDILDHINRVGQTFYPM